MSKYVDGIIGYAIGDAMGGTIEFESRNKLFKNPVTKMIGYDSYNVSLGIWSDDIAMEIATIDSFINKGCFDYKDIMRNFKSWLEKNKFTTDVEVFDVENSCMQSISNFSKGCKLQECGQNDLHSTGNSSLMRILPVALYSYSNSLDENEIIKLTNEVSSLTHTHEISKLGCYIYVRYVIFLLQELDKNSAYCELRKLDYSYYSKESVDVYQRILKEDISKLNAAEIRSSGYIVDTLEASIWVILQCNSFSESIISAINLGDDKVSAVTGSIAGIIYGYNDIPEEWLNVLKRKECIIDMALKFENKSSSLKKDVILGTIIGDIAGSRFEIVNNKYGKRFKLLHNRCIFTDDSVMTLAVAKAFLNSKEDLSDLKEKVIEAITNIGRKYPNCGYGPKFYRWIFSDDHMPYGSFGNGSAMRISSVGVAIKSIDRIKEIVNVITNISHNHADSIAGSLAVAIAIRMALNGEDKESIRLYIESNYFKIDHLKKDIMKPQEFHINCVETVKQSLGAFLNSYDFEDAIRNAIALGGDSDTIAAITGSIAAAYYGIPEDICNNAIKYLDEYLMKIYNDFNKRYNV